MRAIFSHRFFAHKAGFTSSSFCLSVIKGRYNLSPVATTKIVRALELDPRQTAYFQALVNYNQSKRSEEREEAWTRIRELRKQVEFASLREPQQKYFSHWYYPVLRELATHPSWDGDFIKLARWLDPQLSTEEARSGVHDLVEWGILSLDEAGKYHPTDALIHAEGTPPVALRQIRREFLQHGIGALDTKTPAQRFATFSTLAMSEDSYEFATQVLEEARRKIIARAAGDSQVEKVYQMVLQVFPLSRALTEDSQ